MIRETIATVDGEEIETLAPEDDEDLAELERMAEAGELDDELSFGDVDSRPASR